MKIQENIPLAPLTTLKVGGPARYFVEATCEKDVIFAVEYSRSNHLPLFVLGGGSNLLVADSGWPGLVLKVSLRGITQQDDPATGKRDFNVAAGEDWDGFVAQAVAQNCAGIETLSGIPGTVGGTPVQNVGAYGQEVSQTIELVEVLDTFSMQIRELPNQACGFSYRTSVFNSSERGRYIVLNVRFALVPGGQPNLTYADLTKHFATTAIPTLQQTREAVREIRLSKAMLIVPDDQDCRSAGSFFKNPIIPIATYQEVAVIAGRSGIAPPPNYPAGHDEVKISAAWLVEQAGFKKGYAKGAAGISKRHSLAIINRGGATAAEILALKNEVQQGVKMKFGIELVAEPVLIGFDH